MPTTTNRGYSIPATGTEIDVWGASDLNPNFAAIDNNLGGVSNVALSNANVTLTPTQYACGTIRLSGVLTSDVGVFFPAVQGWWTIDNQTTGSAFVAQITTGTGQIISVDQGSQADILIDGTNVKFRNLPAVGTYLDICDGTVPRWITACTVPPYINCDGSTFSAATYPYLAAKLSGNTLPDARGRNRSALNQGTSRITTSNSGINGDVRFSAGGSELLQSHNHQVQGSTGGESTGHTHGGVLTSVSGFYSSPGGATVVVQSVASGSTGGPSNDHTHNLNFNSQPAGSGTSQNMPPTLISGLTLIRAA